MSPGRGGFSPRFLLFRCKMGIETCDGLSGIVELMERSGAKLPDPDSTVQQLRLLKPLLKITQLANLAGMKPSTLSSKIDRGGPFTEEEAERLKSVLSCL